MIAEIGLAALWLAAALALLQLVSALLSWRLGPDNPLAKTMRPVSVLQAILCAGSFLALMWLFIQTDLSVRLVVINSHSDKPFIFKLAGTWGNHEGSMLLWVTVMAIAGGMIGWVERRLPEMTILATLGAQAFVSLGFYAFLLFSSNPFERMAEPPPQGQGLNPLLQDIGLALHPPTLYFGYVGLSVAFSFAVGALLTKQVTPDFARAMRPWVLAAWIFLTLGITAGSYWAYYELGWGGWWFWDPVENASLMPWIAATALLHSVSVLAARDALRTWTIMLGVVAFSMSMVGTFLVRSGILTSVHAFAVDPERGSFILALLTIYIGGALVLFGLRANTISEGERFSLTSREAALVVNNVMLSAILGIVLLGTLYPLITEAFDVRVSVGPPYFNPVSAIFFFPMISVLAVGPLLRWRNDSMQRIKAPLILFGLIVVAVIAATLALKEITILPLLGLAMGLGLLVASVMPLKGRRLARVPLATWGMVVAHFGIGVALVGMASESAFFKERLVAVELGDSAEVGPWTVKLEAVKPVAGDNWTAIEGRLAASYGSGEPTLINSQQRHFWSPEMETSEVALLTRWNGQLYAVIGEETDDGRWQLRLWWKPLVTLIWFGGLLIALGGLLALIGRVMSTRKRAYIEARLAERRAEEAAL